MTESTCVATATRAARSPSLIPSLFFFSSSSTCSACVKWTPPLLLLRVQHQAAEIRISAQRDTVPHQGCRSYFKCDGRRCTDWQKDSSVWKKQNKTKHQPVMFHLPSPSHSFYFTSFQTSSVCTREEILFSDFCKICSWPASSHSALPSFSRFILVIYFLEDALFFLPKSVPSLSPQYVIQRAH